jgi:hypothetical protein
MLLLEISFNSIYNVWLEEHHLYGGSDMIWRPLVFLASLSLLGGGMCLQTSQSSVKENQSIAYAYDPTQYTDLLSEDSYFSYAIRTSTHSDYYQSFGFALADEGDENYVLGNYEKGEHYYPLTFYYDVKKADGGTETRSTIGSLKSSIYSYDAIGNSFASLTDFQSYADLPIVKGETIDYSTLKIVNIFHVTETISGSTSTFEIDYSKNYVLQGPSIKTAAKTNYYLNDFVSDAKLNKVAVFNNYSSITVSYKSLVAERFKELSSKYQDNIDSINSGAYSIRTRLNSLTNSIMRVTYDDGTQITRSITGTTYLNLSLTGEWQFLLTDIDSAHVVSFDLLNATIYSDIYDNSLNTIISKTSLSWRFGDISFKTGSDTTPAGVDNYVATILFTCLGLVLVYGGIAVAYYFYKKKKYRNDEFNRVVPKEYIKRSSIGFGYCLIASLSILFIVARSAVFANSLTVFNPFDPLIMAFVLIWLIYTGYYIKYFIAKFKDYKVKKMEEKLNLGNDVEDDGTVLIENNKKEK